MAQVATGLEAWLALIPPENNQKPNFMAMLTAVLQPFADSIGVANSLTGLFDLTTAVGSQLDIVGQWIGITRNIPVPNTNTFIALTDPQYLALLQAKIAMNQWNGTIPAAQAALNLLFPENTVLIQDSENNHMSFALMPQVVFTVSGAITPNLTGSYTEAGTFNGNPYYQNAGPNAGFIWFFNIGSADFWIISTTLGVQTDDFFMTFAGPPVGTFAAQGGATGTATVAGQIALDDLFSAAVLNALVPAGITVDGFFLPSGGTPYFGTDAENASISGPDVGFLVI